MCSGRSVSRDLHVAFSVRKTLTMQTRAAMHCRHTVKQKCTRTRCSIIWPCIDRYFIIHSYFLVILLDFSLKMHQNDAFKYEIYKIFFWGGKPRTPERDHILLTFFTPHPFSCLFIHVHIHLKNLAHLWQHAQFCTHHYLITLTNPW